MTPPCLSTRSKPARFLAAVSLMLALYLNMIAGDASAQAAAPSPDDSQGLVPVHLHAASAGGMQRIGKLTLSSGSYSGLYCAVIDAVNGYVYFATANAINPGRVIKVDVNGPLPVEVGATAVAAGEVNLDSCVIDVAAGYAYFGTTTAPGRVIKVALGAGNTPPAYVGSLALNAGEDTDWGAVIDTHDPDPANHYIYFATRTSPGKIVKVAPGAGNTLPTRVGALTLQAGEDLPRRGLIDLINGYAYFATTGVTPKIIKVGLTAGNAPPTWVGAVMLDASTPYNIGSAVIDAANGYAYFGMYDVDAGKVPAKVYKVALGAGNTTPSLVGALTLNSGERELSTAVIDPANGFAYFGTDHTYPAKIFQVALGAGNALPTETGVLQLQGGTQPNPPDGQNVINKPETSYGEVFLQSSVIDPANHAAYFGADSDHGQVAKVALPIPAAPLTPTAWIYLPLILR